MGQSHLFLECLSRDFSPSKLAQKLNLHVVLFCQMLYVPVNNCSVVLGRYLVFLCRTSSKHRIKGLDQHNDPTGVVSSGIMKIDIDIVKPYIKSIQIPVTEFKVSASGLCLALV